jgi:chitodextrinase
MMPWINDLDDASAAAFTKIYQNELADTYVTYASNASGTSGNASTFSRLIPTTCELTAQVFG